MWPQVALMLYRGLNVYSSCIQFGLMLYSGLTSGSDSCCTVAWLALGIRYSGSQWPHIGTQVVHMGLMLFRGMIW